MSEIAVEIIKPGLFTTIQDHGRFGYVNMGVPIGGAMDIESMEMANQLVGNSSSQPTLECTLIGPSIKFDSATQIALCGAPFKPKVNGVSKPMFQTVNIEAGDLLEIGQTEHGCRAYLAIRGDWQEEKWLGSYSTPSIYLNSFGLQTQLNAGKRIKIKGCQPIENRIIRIEQQPIYSDCTILRTVTSPDFELLDFKIIEAFYESVFTISNDSNRMGYRLKEHLKSYHKKGEALSSGIIPGTIQITNNGQPIILTADAQTTGGYTRIANVIRQDLDMLGQLRPGNRVKFQLTSLDSFKTTRL